MNLPNRITLIRLILVPVFIIICVFPYEMFNIQITSFSFLMTKMTIIDILSFLVFVIASITDYLDGQIARRKGLVTTFGKFVDPVADKMIVNSALIILTYERRISVICLLIMVLRDTFVDAIRFAAASKNTVVAANLLGKAKTMTQMIGISLVLLNNPIFNGFNFPLDQIFIYLATIISAISGINYFILNKDYILETM